MRSMRVVKRARERKRERERETERQTNTHTHTQRERERERTRKDDARAARTADERASERVEEEEEEEEEEVEEEKRREIWTFPQNRCFSSFFSFFFLSLFSRFRCVIFYNKNKTTRNKHTQRKEREARVIMDESWEELKRNAILLGSWIALIRASTYIFGAFQKAD